MMNYYDRHSGVGRNPVFLNIPRKPFWIPAFAGMTGEEAGMTGEGKNAVVMEKKPE